MLPQEEHRRRIFRRSGFPFSGATNPAYRGVSKFQAMALRIYDLAQSSLYASEKGLTSPTINFNNVLNQPNCEGISKKQAFLLCWCQYTLRADEEHHQASADEQVSPRFMLITALARLKSSLLWKPFAPETNRPPQSGRIIAALGSEPAHFSDAHWLTRVELSTRANVTGIFSDRIMKNEALDESRRTR